MMPSSSASPPNPRDEKEFTDEQMRRVIQALEPQRWGFKSRRHRHPAVERRAGATPVFAHGTRNSCPLPPYPPAPAPAPAVAAARSTSRSSVATVTKLPPAAKGAPKCPLPVSESPSVAVRAPDAVMREAPLVTLLAPRHPRQCGAAVASDGEAVEPTDVDEPSESTSLSGVLPDHSCLQRPQPLGLCSSVSSLSDFTRMESVHPSDSARPVARMQLFARRGTFVPTSLSAGLRPSKQCLAPTATFSATRKASPAPFSELVVEEAPQSAEPLMPQTVGCDAAAPLPHHGGGTREAAVAATHSVSPAVEASGAPDPVDGASPVVPVSDVAVQTDSGEAAPSSPIVSVAFCPIKAPTEEVSATTVENAADDAATSPPSPATPSVVLTLTPVALTAADADPPRPLPQGSTTVDAETPPTTPPPPVEVAAPEMQQATDAPPTAAALTPAPPATLTPMASVCDCETVEEAPVAPAPPTPPVSPAASAPVSPTPTLTRRTLCRVPTQRGGGQSAAAPGAPTTGTAPSAALPVLPRETAPLVSPAVGQAKSEAAGAAAAPQKDLASPPPAVAAGGAARGHDKPCNAGGEMLTEPAPPPPVAPSGPTGAAMRCVEQPTAPSPPPRSTAPIVEVKKPSPLSPAATAVAAVEASAAAAKSPAAPIASAQQPVSPALQEKVPSPAKCTTLCTVRLCTEAPSPKNRDHRFMRLAAAERFY